MSRRRFSGLHNKYLKQQHDLMTSFGYELVEFSKGDRGGHPIYAREGFESMELSSTPRNEQLARKLLLVELRRRHPEHQMWRSMQKRKAKPGSRSRRKEKQLAHARALVGAGEREARARVAAEPTDLDYVGCVDCGYRWQSDYDPAGRPCPRCGGDIRAPRQRSKQNATPRRVRQPWEPKEAA